jgi:hypothetical protein
MLPRNVPALPVVEFSLQIWSGSRALRPAPGLQQSCHGDLWQRCARSAHGQGLRAPCHRFGPLAVRDTCGCAAGRTSLVACAPSSPGPALMHATCGHTMTSACILLDDVCMRASHDAVRAFTIQHVASRLLCPPACPQRELFGC